MLLKESDHISLEALFVETGSLLREAVEVGERFHHLSRYGTLRLLVRGSDERIILLEVYLEATCVNTVVVGEGIVKVAQSPVFDKSWPWMLYTRFCF